MAVHEERYEAPAVVTQTHVRPSLRRSRDDRVLFGVCGGLGRYLGIDSVFVRIGFVLLAVFGGSGLLLYLIGAIAIPSAEAGEAPSASELRAGGAPAFIVGGILMAVGSLMLANQVIPGFGRLFGPMLLVAVGAAVILAGRR